MPKCLSDGCNRTFKNVHGRNNHMGKVHDMKKICIQLLQNADSRPTYQNAFEQLGVSSATFEKYFDSWSSAVSEYFGERNITGKNNPCWRGGRTSELNSCYYCCNFFTGRADRKNKYCSQKCKHLQESLDFSGKDNHQWRGGHKKYKGESWSSARKNARNRANNVCEHPKCSRTPETEGRELDVHHIIPFRLFDDHKNANDLNNLILLCREHHSNLDSSIRKIERLYTNRRQ